MVRCKFGGGINRGFLAILTILALQIGVFKDRLNSYGGYFLVRGGDKKCEEYKNWVKILSDSYKRAILVKKMVNMGEYRNENWVKMVKKKVNIRMKLG